MYCENVVSLHRKQKNKPINRAATYKRRKKMTKTTKSCSLNEAIESLTKIANAYAIIYDCTCIDSDMKISVEELQRTNVYQGCFFGEFYFAIRRAGVESGSLDHVKSRCHSLGSPVCVVKIQRQKESKNVLLAINSK